jgi:hypothetical protein
MGLLYKCKGRIRKMKRKFILCITIMALIVFNEGGSSGSANAQSGGRTLNSAAELKTYLASQPANGPTNPIIVSMTINDAMFKSVADVIFSAGKYVSLNITGSALTTIPDQAFYDESKDEGCKTLVSITMPNSVTSIGERAFTNCIGLTSITIPNRVTIIDYATFTNCNGLTSVTIPNSVTIIDELAFGACTSLTSITIPNSVTSIGDETFMHCIKLTSITIPNSVTSIGERAFYNCKSLTSITMPNRVTQIERAAFSRCTSLTSITIPNSVTGIGASAFDSCTSLTSVTIPSSVTEIGSGAFSGCASLTRVTFERGDIIQIYINIFPEGASNAGGNNLRNTYVNQGAGTYTRAAGGTTWTKR